MTVVAQYQPNVPNKGETLQETQVPILTDFTQINTLIGVNHVPFGSPINDPDAGKHNFVQMDIVNGTPASNTNDGTLYAQSSSAFNQLFYTNDNTGNQYEITNINDAYKSSFDATHFKGWTFLPGNLIMQWHGGASADASTSVLLTGAFKSFKFARKFKELRAFTFGLAFGSIATGQPQISNLTVEGFSARAIVIAPINFYYIAIGTPA